MPSPDTPDENASDPSQPVSHVDQNEEPGLSSIQEQEFYQGFNQMLNRLVPRMVSHNDELTNLHASFLSSRQESLAMLGQLTGDQIVQDLNKMSEVLPPNPDLNGYAQHSALKTQEQFGSQKSPAIPIFDRRQLDQFATGRITDCLGPAYAVYGTRRTPRIPNAELMLMSRITEVAGTRWDFSHPASITAEYDMPANPWFYPSGSVGDIPYSMLMEIALQPCGFLSAYLETPLIHPEEDYYFRNLDGQSMLLERMDLRGKTVTTHANLVKTTMSAGIIIQFFTFDLRVEGFIFFQGQAIFGYFPAATMADQVGLDSGKAVLPWIRGTEASATSQTAASVDHDHAILLSNLPANTRPPLDHMDALIGIPDGGRFQHGYIYARKQILPHDWYFKCHFYDDPVMPGSLGIEAILRALREYALRVYFPQGTAAPLWVHTQNTPMTWRYRGQIRPDQQAMELEVHISQVIPGGSSITISADASLWIDGVRIYEVSSISMTFGKGAR